VVAGRLCQWRQAACGGGPLVVAAGAFVVWATVGSPLEAWRLEDTHEVGKSVKTFTQFTRSKNGQKVYLGQTSVNLLQFTRS
jgi:hypothetical protein